MNVNELDVPPLQDIQRISTDAEDKEAEFLSLRLLNKRARVRLSPEPLDLQPLPGKGQLFSVANSKGWFVAVVRNNGADALIFSPLFELRAAITKATPENAETVFTPERTLGMTPATANLITFASADTRLVVGLTQGPVLVYDTSKLFSTGTDEVAPLHSFPSTTSGAPRLILPNPGDIPDLVAVLRDANGDTSSQLVEILDVQKMECVGGWRGGKISGAAPTSLSWSPKGKQIAVGLQSGDIITFSPTETGKYKSVFGRPPRVNGQSVISINWLTNTTIHTIFAPPGPIKPEAEQTHMLMALDSKKNVSADVRLNTPYFPSPGLRPPGSFMTVLRGWDPMKFIIFVGDSTSSDIGVIGSTADENWHNFSLEETSTPSLPLDKDMNDTVLIALDLDLTSEEQYRHQGNGETRQLPPPPIMYAYVNDGTLLAWNIINSAGQPYPGMVAASFPIPVIVAPKLASAQSQNDMQMATAPVTPITGPTAGGFGQQPALTFGQSAFGPPSFGRPLLSFGQPALSPAFGQSSGVGTSSSASGQSPIFDKPSAFGQVSSFKPVSSSAFGSSTPSVGFGHFASAAPTKFGQSSFGFGSSMTPTPAQVSEASPTSAPEEPMASDEAPSFGGLSLGGASNQESTFGTGPSIFGQAAMSSTDDNSSTSVFGSSANKIVKPASGFGAFSNFASPSNMFGGSASKDTNSTEAPKPGAGFGAFLNLTSQPSAFSDSNSKNITSSEPPQAASAFGKSGFDVKSSSTFGQSGFGQSGFGQISGSTFGKPSVTASTPSMQPVIGGFSAFASSGTSSFGSAAKQTTDATKVLQPASGGFSAFAQAGTSSLLSAAQTSSTTSFKPAWATGKSAFGAQSSSVFGNLGQNNNTLGGSVNAIDGGAVFGQPSVVAKEEHEDVAILAGDMKRSISPFSAETPQVQSPFSSLAVKEPEATKVTSGNVSASSGSTSVFNGSSAFRSSPFDSKGDKVDTNPLSTLKSVHPVAPSLSPVSSEIDSPSPFSQSDNITSTSSPFRSDASSSGFGAFGQLKATSTGFIKPAEGFGAFAGAVSEDSPFYNLPKELGTKPTSAFALSRSSPNSLSKTGAGDSVFGSPSVLSSSKSALGSLSIFGQPSLFGSPSIPTPAHVDSLSELKTGGFGSFSGTGGFGAFAGTKTASFGGLLKGSADSEDPAKPVISVFGDLSKTSLSPKAEVSASIFTKHGLGTAKGTSASTSPEKPETPSKDENASAADEISNIRDKEELKAAPVFPSSLGSSLASISHPSQNSSFVEVTPPDEDGTSNADASDEQSHSGSDVEDYTRSFLSEEFSDERSEEEEEGSGEDGSDPSDEVSRPATPEDEPVTQFPAPTPRSKSRSPSTTPKPEPSNLQMTRLPSPPLVTNMKVISSDKVGEANSTTPPGSPSKDDEDVPLSKAPVQAAVSPFGAGLGRPSTRPSRSSPLASFPMLPVVTDTSNTSTGVNLNLATSRAPKPASPKLPFGVLPNKPVEVQTQPVQSKRPKTPPLLSVTSTPSTSFGFAVQPKATSSYNAPSDFSAPKLKASSVPSVTDKTQKTQSRPSPSHYGDRSGAPSPPPDVFSKTPSVQAPIPSNASASSSLFQKQPALPVAFSATSTFFGAPTKASMPAPASTRFVNASATISSSPFGNQLPSAPTFAPVPLSAPAVPEPQGQGMQAECAYLFVTLTKELDQLREYAQRTSARREHLVQATGLSHHKDNMGDSSHWTLGDVKSWGKVLKTVQDDIELLRDNKKALSQSLREIESSMLRVGTKKEEIARFNKAKTDPEFSKMLKVRTLGPEHLETQTQLRRDIRNTCDRVQKLEDYLADSKKRLTRLKTGKPGVRPPSLDTIHRTYRNIDIALDYQAQKVTQLTARLQKIKLNSGQLISSTRDTRLPDPRRAYNATPSVVVNAANALNGEVSAQRLRRALFSVRQQPLLNTSAITAPTAPVAFSTPQKTDTVKQEPEDSFNFAPFAPSAMEQPWNPAPFTKMTASTPRSRSGASMHSSSVKLKRDSKSPFSGQSSPAPSFDWGPLPVIAPAKGLPFEFGKMPST